MLRPVARKRFRCRCKGECTKWRRVMNKNPYLKKQILAEKERLAKMVALRRKRLVDSKKKAVAIKCTTRTVELCKEDEIGEEKSKLLFMLALGLTPTVGPRQDTTMSLPVVAIEKLSATKSTKAKAVTESRLREIRLKRKLIALQQWQRRMKMRLIQPEPVRRERKIRDANVIPEVVNLISSEEDEDDSKTINLSSDSDDNKDNVPMIRKPVRINRASEYLRNTRTLSASGNPKTFSFPRQAPGLIKLVCNRAQSRISKHSKVRGMPRKRPVSRPRPTYHPPRPAILSLLDRASFRNFKRGSLQKYVPKMPVRKIEGESPLQLPTVIQRNVFNRPALNFPEPATEAGCSPRFNAPEIVITIDDDE